MTDAHCHVSCGDSSIREFLIGRDFFGIHPWETLGEISGKDEVGLTNGKGKAGVTSGKGELTLSDPKLTLFDPTSTLNDPILTLSGPISTLSDPILTLLDPISKKLLANPRAGVGEIGLDRLKCRDIPPLMREVFERQLALAVKLRRPVVLHGAKCWGQVVEACKAAVQIWHLRQSEVDCRLSEDAMSNRPPTFLFHGFSRSDGLIPDIVKLNGYISVGPAVLNDHAVNYCELVKKIPLDRLLVETDRTDLVGTSALARPQLVGTSALARPPAPTIYDVLAKVAELRGVSAAELEKITDENAERFMGASL